MPARTLYFYWPGSGSLSWNNVANWWNDSPHTSHAASIPANGDSVIMLPSASPFGNDVTTPTAGVTLASFDATQYVNSDFFDSPSGGDWSFGGTIAIASGGSLAIGIPGDGGSYIVSWSGSDTNINVTLYGIATLNGSPTGTITTHDIVNITQPIQGNWISYDSSYNSQTMFCNWTSHDNSFNNGDVEGTWTSFDSSFNEGSVTEDWISYQSSSNSMGGVVTGSWTSHDLSYNLGFVSGPWTSYGNSNSSGTILFGWTGFDQSYAVNMPSGSITLTPTSVQATFINAIGHSVNVDTGLPDNSIVAAPNTFGPPDALQTGSLAAGSSGKGSLRPGINT